MKISVVAIIIVISIAGIPMSMGCDSGKAKAVDMARDWTSANVTLVSSSTALICIQEIPGITTEDKTLLEGQIAERVLWTYSIEREFSDGVCDMVAKAACTISVPLKGNYRISMDVALLVYTEEERVVLQWFIHDSFRYSES